MLDIEEEERKFKFIYGVGEASVENKGLEPCCENQGQDVLRRIVPPRLSAVIKVDLLGLYQVCGLLWVDIRSVSHMNNKWNEIAIGLLELATRESRRRSRNSYKEYIGMHVRKGKPQAFAGWKADVHSGYAERWNCKRGTATKLTAQGVKATRTRTKTRIFGRITIKYD
ncbi:hypothetical protein Tco_0831492 [Tanacetum coccineum]